MTLEAVALAHRELTSRLEAFNSECIPRRRRIDFHHPAVSGGRWLVDMGFVDDDKDANILSWAARRFMVCERIKEGWGGIAVG